MYSLKNWLKVEAGWNLLPVRLHLMWPLLRRELSMALAMEKSQKKDGTVSERVSKILTLRDYIMYESLSITSSLTSI